jgi:hypothetical protein
MSTDLHTPAMAESLGSAYRRRRQEGTLWTAPSGGQVRIRKLTITDHAMINSLPDNLRKVVYDVIDADTRLRGEADDDDEIDPFGGMTAEEKLETLHDLSIRVSRLGWLDPRIVDEVRDPDHEITVDEADENDMLEYMTMVFKSNFTEAQPMATFPDRPAGGVEPRPDVPAVSPAAQPGDADDGERLLRADSV